jgi:hypothetical protein
MSFNWKGTNALVFMAYEKLCRPSLTIGASSSARAVGVMLVSKDKGLIVKQLSEPCESMADGRGRDVQFAGSASDAAMSHNGLENPKEVEINLSNWQTHLLHYILRAPQSHGRPARATTRECSSRQSCTKFSNDSTGPGCF